jgi:hypothetical protein
MTRDWELDAFLASHGYGTRAYRDAKARQSARPKVVAEAGKVVGEAEVRVSEADPNYRPQAPRPGFVTVNVEVAERMWLADRAQAREEAEHRRWLDPVGLGHWGPRR